VGPSASGKPVGQGHRNHHRGRENRQVGDGKIFVFGLEQAVRIRTGETDAAAL
jgi:nitrogen regulatory protein PII